MKTKLYLDKRGKKEDEEAPVKIAINKDGTSAYIATGISLLITQWDDKSCEVKNHANKMKINIALSRKKMQVDQILEELAIAGRLHNKSAAKIRKMIKERMEVPTEMRDLFMYRFEQWGASRTKPRTRKDYAATARKIRAFDDTADDLRFEDITRKWLKGFDNWMARTMPSPNARSVHMRNIRAVFNDAIDDGITTEYPFRKMKLTLAPTKDRSLSKEELIKILSFPCEEAQKEYRDIFQLMFLLCGINLSDIVSVKGIRDGRIEITRAKTGQPISIRIIPEAQEIIDRYAGKHHLLNIVERYKDYRDYASRMNKHLKRIGMTYDPHLKQWIGKAICPELSAYWARYTFATIAAELDIPERTIGAALGHSTKKSVTSIYIRTDMRRKIDEAQRKVANYVFGEKF